MDALPTALACYSVIWQECTKELQTRLRGCLTVKWYYGEECHRFCSRNSGKVINGYSILNSSWLQGISMAASCIASFHQAGINPLNRQAALSQLHEGWDRSSPCHPGHLVNICTRRALHWIPLERRSEMIRLNLMYRSLEPIGSCTDAWPNKLQTTSQNKYRKVQMNVLTVWTKSSSPSTSVGLISIWMSTRTSWDSIRRARLMLRAWGLPSDRDVLLGMNAKVADCHGQCYDGVSNVRAARKGEAVMITQEESQALYTRCYGHALDLAVADTVEAI